TPPPHRLEPAQSAGTKKPISAAATAREPIRFRFVTAMEIIPHQVPGSFSRQGFSDFRFAEERRPIGASLVRIGSFRHHVCKSLSGIRESFNDCRTGLEPGRWGRLESMGSGNAERPRGPRVGRASMWSPPHNDLKGRLNLVNMDQARSPWALLLGRIEIGT